MKNYAAEIPSIVNRIGDKNFLKVPLYPRNQSARPMYINREVYSHLFPETVHLSWDALSAHVTETFNVTINRFEQLEEQIGWAYVDYQSDTNNAANGNGGSGRAYFVGKQFNIKGECTPLANEQTPGLGQFGMLSMGFAIWSTMVANTLYGDSEIALAPVLAIIDLQMCHTEHEREVKHVLVIREVSHGELDRVNNHINNQTPLNKNDFEKAITAMATQAAEKYIQRVLHGAVHSGNMTLEGHLVDFDTVGFTKGRQPQSSYGSHHLENFFGYEHLACYPILQSLTKNVVMNTNQLTFEHCKKQFDECYHTHLGKKMIYLLGFSDYKQLYKNHRDEIDLLAKLFVELGAYSSLTQERGYNSQHPITLTNFFFDFSALFRVLGLYYLQDTLTVESGLCALVGEERFLDETDDNIFPFHVMQHAFPNELNDTLRQYVITKPDELDPLYKAAVNFIKGLSSLYQLLLKETSDKLQMIVSNAYIINEDRLYLLHPFKLNRLIIQAKSTMAANDWIDKVIAASKRGSRLTVDEPVADMRLFEEGQCYLQFNQSRERWRAVFILSTIEDRLLSDRNIFEISICGERHSATLQRIDKGVRIVSDEIDLQALVLNEPREQAFTIRLFDLYLNNTKYHMTDLYHRQQDVDKYI